MARQGRFTFIANDDELQLLTALADHLERSRSDVLRWLIRGTAKRCDIKIDGTETTPTPSAHVGEASREREPV